MDIEKAAEKAVDLKLHHGYNCSQAVTCALKDECDLNEEELKMISAGFCAGMGNMKATCGALIGAVMIAGLKTKGNGTLPYARRISEAFEASCGALTCRVLKGIDEGEVLCPCEDCVANAVRAYGKVFENQ